MQNIAFWPVIHFLKKILSPKHVSQQAWLKLAMGFLRRSYLKEKVDRQMNN